MGFLLIPSLSFSETPSSTVLQLYRGPTQEVQGRGNKRENVELRRGTYTSLVKDQNDNRLHQMMAWLEQERLEGEREKGEADTYVVYQVRL